MVEGRRTFANTIKYVLMGTSSNFGNMFSAAGASLFLSRRYFPRAAVETYFPTAEISRAVRRPANAGMPPPPFVTLRWTTAFDGLR